MYYATINADGICDGVSELSGAVADQKMIVIPAYDPSLVGKKYENGQFSEVAPPKNFKLTPYQFRALFTFEEQVAITIAAKSDVAIEVFMKGLEIAQIIDLTYPETAAGLTYLVSQGLIKQDKMDNILAGF